MSITKWKTRTHSAEILAVECVRETAASVWITEQPWQMFVEAQAVDRKHAKRSDSAIYHDTWDAAHKHLMERATMEVQSARRRLELANAKLGNVKGLRNPAAPAKEHAR